MKNLSWILPVGIVGYLVYQAQLAKNTVQQLSAMVFGIKYDKANSSYAQTTLLVTLRINNPTFNSVSFQSFQGSVFVDGKNIFQAAYNPGGGITIKESAYTDVIFPVTVNNVQLALTAKDLAAQWVTGNFNQDLRIVGTLTAGGLQIPTDTTTRLSSIGALGRINGTNALGPFTPFLDY